MNNITHTISQPHVQQKKKFAFMDFENGRHLLLAGHFSDMRFGFLFLMICFGLMKSYAQFTVSGTVTDSVTNEPLLLVTVIENDNDESGVLTSDNGKFTVTDSVPILKLRFTYVGYDEKEVIVTNEKSIEVRLAPVTQQLDNVEIFSGENPADRIIKQTVKNRDENDYYKLNSYSYNAYEKFVVNAAPPDSSSNKKLQALFDELHQHYLLISESYINRIHLSPDLTKETVIAQKVSGLKDPNFTVLISEFQSTDFYKPVITIADEEYINPISDGSWHQYFFNVEDTLYQNGDTVFVMSYVPAKGKTFQSLKGTLQINASTYAIQYVKASPADTAVATLSSTIEQYYQRNDSIWFPARLNIDIGFKKFFISNMPVRMTGTTIIDSIKINPAITQKDFDGVAVDLLPDAAKHDSSFWQAHRLDSISEKEIQSYKYIDSLGHHLHLDEKVQLINALQDGNLQLPLVSIELYRLLKYDKPENVRAGIGLETNNTLSKHFVVGAWIGYGLKDSLWKQGGFAELKLLPQKNITLSFTNSSDYEENGGYHFFQEGYFGSAINARNYTISNYDFVKRNEIDFTARLRKYVNVQLSAFNANKQITNQYLFNDGTDISLDQFEMSGVQCSLRFSYKERVVESFNHYYWIKEGYPTIWLQYRRGIKIGRASCRERV